MAEGTRPHNRASILLIYNEQGEWYDVERYFYTRAPSIGLGYLASCLRDKGHQVAICDLQIESAKNLWRTLDEMQPEIIGLSCLASTMVSTFKLITGIRKRSKALIVLGGPQATNWPFKLLDRGFADCVVIGEGENTITEIADLTASGTKDFSSLTGVGYMAGNTAMISPPSQGKPKLDDLPFPAFDLLDLSRYASGPNRATKGLVIPIVTQRGCPFGCRYCDSEAVFGRAVRYRGALSIKEEILYWKRKFENISLLVWDDTFTFNREHCLQACEVFQKSDVEWSCTTRPDYVDNELLVSMRKCGCKNIYFGAESFSPETLTMLNRTTTADVVKKAVFLARDAGIRTSVGIVTGFPLQRVAEICRDIQMLFDLGVEYPTINLFKSYSPKTFAYFENSGISHERVAECAFQGIAINPWRERFLNVLRLGSLTKYHMARAYRLAEQYMRSRSL
ncbi:MAG: radical SAM protein [Syntrophobacteraceae bacterium]|jgi:radical SAM superfamily enzyme YgiQ (UPF0313 family)